MARKPSITPADMALIRELRASGAELRELGELWGFTKQYIHKLTQDIKPNRDGRRMVWVTKVQVLELLNAWRPALPTEGLPLPYWIVRRGIGCFHWSKDKQKPLKRKPQ